MINSLTSLRFFFALCVFVSHLGILQTDPKYKMLYDKIFYEGFLGVSFFFILSGFILSYAYNLRLKKSYHSIKNFYVGRIARIYPVHIVTMLIALLFALILGQKDLHLLPNMLLLQSFFSSQDIYFSLNAPSWSISDEMFFYFLFPIAVFISSRYKLIAFILFSILIIFFNIYLNENLKHYWLYISPFTRFADFLLGMLLYQYSVQLQKKQINSNLIEIISLLIFFMFFIFHDYIPVSFRYSIYYWIPMSLIITSFALSFMSGQLGLISKVLSNKLLVFLGEISFCFYLSHLLIMQVMFFIKKHLNISIDLLIFSTIVLICTIIFSSLLHKYIELPLNKQIKGWLS